MTKRLISENAVIALVQGKIDALQDRRARLNAKENPTDRDLLEDDKAIAKISALETVIHHLRFIDNTDVEMTLIEVSNEISNINRLAGETRFNPAATSALRALMGDEPVYTPGDGEESAMCPFTAGGEFPIEGLNA